MKLIDNHSVDKKENNIAHNKKLDKFIRFKLSQCRIWMGRTVKK